MSLRRVWLLAGLVGATPVSAQSIPRWTAERDLLLDGTAQSFIQMEWLRVSPVGEIYVMQGRDLNIRVFDSLGAPVRTIGRRGSGPGEFVAQQALSAGFVGDSLWVHEIGSRRVNVFAPGGQSARLTTLASPKGSRIANVPLRDLSSPVVVGLASDGTYRVHTFYMPTRNAETKDPRFLAPIYQMSERGDVRSVVAVVGSGEDMLVHEWSGGKGVTNVMPIPMPFPNPTQHAFSADGEQLVVARAAVAGTEAGWVTVVRIDARGDTIYMGRFPATKEPLSRETVESAFASMVKMLETSGDSRGAAVVRAAPRPEFAPPLTQVVVARDGAALLLFTHQGMDRDGLLISPDGRPVAMIRLPRNFTVEQMDNQSLWGYVLDADGIPSVVRYRLARAAGIH